MGWHWAGPQKQFNKGETRMFYEKIFTLITRLMTSRWAQARDEHHSPYEESLTARLGPLRLSANYCFVLDHQDASVSLALPLPRGQLYLGYTVCLGEEQVRRTGWEARRVMAC
jgi:hypothetical protein